MPMAFWTSFLSSFFFLFFFELSKKNALLIYDIGFPGVEGGGEEEEGRRGRDSSSSSIRNLK